MEKKERDFKGVWIPKILWLNTDLSIIEKCLLVEIDSLDNDPNKGCWASNEYLGQFIGVSEGRCANIISALKKRGYISQVFFDGRNRGLRAHYNILESIIKSESSFNENVNAQLTETLDHTSRKREHSNIDNNTSNNQEKETPTPFLNKKSKPQPILLSIPNCLNTPEFMERWGALLKTKKWCKKANSTLQNILEELSKYDVEFAIKIMGNTIMNEYQGLIFDNTPEVYEKWKKAKASTPQNQIFQQPHPNTPEKPLYCIVNEWQGKKKWAKVWRWANKVAVLENDTERIEFNSLEVVQMSQYKEPIILR